METLYTMITKNDHPDYPFGRVPRTLVIGVGPLNTYLKELILYHYTNVRKK